MKPLISLMKASPWPSHGMRYGTRGGSPVVSLVEEDDHHQAAKKGSARNSQVVAEVRDCAGGTIVFVESMTAFKDSYNEPDPDLIAFVPWEITLYLLVTSRILGWL
jgi:hypothetical protein